MLCDELALMITRRKSVIAGSLVFGRGAWVPLSVRLQRQSVC